VLSEEKKEIHFWKKLKQLETCYSAVFAKNDIKRKVPKYFGTFDIFC
jgi:hypothetical protein